MYGKLPDRKDLLGHKLKVIENVQWNSPVSGAGNVYEYKCILLTRYLYQKERKYFDSGDYALSKAGKEPEVAIGSEHPSPDTIPHSNPNANQSSSPVKESPLVPETKQQEDTTAPSAAAATTTTNN